MNDLISRQAAIDALVKHSTPRDNGDGSITIGLLTASSIEKVLNELPSAERKGKWKRAYLDHEAMGERPSILYCSICDQCIAYPTNFCPNCGADMRGEEE